MLEKTKGENQDEQQQNVGHHYIKKNTIKHKQRRIKTNRKCGNRNGYLNTEQDRKDT
jgi:hypothetical protein